MTERLPDVWTTRDYPVLREVTRRIDTRPYELPEGTDIAADTGLSVDEVRQAALALERRGYVALTKTMGGGITFTDVAGAA